MRIIKNKQKQEKMELIFLIIAFIVFIVGGLLRVGIFGDANLEETFYGIIMVLLFLIFYNMNDLLKRKYYSSSYFSSTIIIKGFFSFIIFLIFPKNYFKKTNFWRGYILYLISKVSLLLAAFSLIKFISYLIIK